MSGEIGDLEDVNVIKVISLNYPLINVIADE